MAQRELTGAGRVTLFPLLHTWPDVYGVAAYTSTGHFGTQAVVGYIPIAAVPDISFYDVAARHVAGAMSATNWILCTGWSSLTVPKPGSLTLDDVQWHLEVDARGVADGDKGSPFMYGHSELYTGRLTFITGTETGEDGRKRLLVDDVLMKQARELLPLPAGAGSE
ncbi:hypothetical protein ABT264_19220 [Streptomyces virginiae]|uniref:hypothetical protein n=1 Tax=Streptomyces virginiae TaxID=1961 RepID=UPI00332CC9B5